VRSTVHNRISILVINSPHAAIFLPPACIMLPHCCSTLETSFRVCYSDARMCYNGLTAFYNGFSKFLAAFQSPKKLLYMVTSSFMVFLSRCHVVPLPLFLSRVCSADQNDSWVSCKIDTNLFSFPCTTFTYT
jgi:hypothetical protein